MCIPAKRTNGTLHGLAGEYSNLEDDCSPSTWYVENDLQSIVERLKLLPQDLDDVPTILVKWKKYIIGRQERRKVQVSDWTPKELREVPVVFKFCTRRTSSQNLLRYFAGPTTFFWV